jgi:hypothetical protein
MFLRLLLNVNRNAALQRKGSLYATAAGKCSERLLDSLWALLKWYRKVAGKCLKATRKPLEKKKKGLKNSCVMLKYPPPAKRRGGRIAQRLSAKMWQFLFSSSEVLQFCFF